MNQQELKLNKVQYFDFEQQRSRQQCKMYQVAGTKIFVAGSVLCCACSLEIAGSFKSAGSVKRAGSAKNASCVKMRQKR